MLEYILIAIIWYICGVLGFIYWWTSESNFTTDEIPLALLVGFTGPIAWVIGLTLYGLPTTGPPKIYIKRRIP